MTNKKIKIHTRNKKIKPGRNSFSVECDNLEKWKIHTSANVQIFKQVLVTSHPIRRGSLLTNTSFHLEKKQLLMEKELLDVQIAELESLSTILHEDDLQNMERIDDPEYLVIKNDVQYVYNY